MCLLCGIIEAYMFPCGRVLRLGWSWSVWGNEWWLKWSEGEGDSEMWGCRGGQRPHEDSPFYLRCHVKLQEVFWNWQEPFCFEKIILTVLWRIGWPGARMQAGRVLLRLWDLSVCERWLQEGREVAEFGTHCGDSSDKVDDGLGRRAKGREVLEWPLYSCHYSAIYWAGEHWRGSCHMQQDEEFTLRCLRNIQEELPTRQLDTGSRMQKRGPSWS